MSWEVIHGDCLKVLPTLQGVSAIITDPVWPNCPPGLLAGSEDPQGLLRRALAAVPDGPTLVSLSLGFDSDPRILAAVPERWPFLRCCWMRYARPSYKGRLLNGADIVYVFGTPPPSREGGRVIPGEFCQVQRKRGVGRDIHPCARNLDHMLWLVEKLTAPDALVLDPFCGSGTTGVACRLTGRRFIGIEINEKYAETARDRIAEAVPLWEASA